MNSNNFLASRFLDSTLTYGWLIRNLQENDSEFRLLSQKAPIKEINYEEIGDGKDFLSKTLRIDLIWEKNDRPFSVVLKIPCLSNVVRDIMDNRGEEYEKNVWEEVRSLHSTECHFYRMFLNKNLCLPKIYATNEIVPNVNDGAVLMQYLKDKAICTKRGVSLTEDQVWSLVNEFAKLAAISLTMKEEELKKFAQPDYSNPKMINMIMDAIEKVTHEKAEFLGNTLERLTPLFTKYFMAYFQETLNSNLGLKPVISHGDLWNDNLYWRKNEKDEAGNDIFAVMDWQTTHTGTIARDLTQILVICTDSKIRRNLKNNIFEVFHKLIKTNLQRNGQNMPITVSQIKECYHREFLKNVMLFPAYANVLTIMNPSEKALEKGQQRNQRVWQRLKDAAQDGYEILQKYLPDWLIRAETGQDELILLS